MRRNCTMRLLVVLSMLVSGYGIAEAAYTYKLLNADGEVVAVTENTTNKYELPWYMESPYVTAYHFYDDEARTVQPMPRAMHSRWPTAPPFT